MTTTKSKEVLRIENWLKTVGIDASKSQDLIDKYGVENTYKLVQEALMRPHDMAKHLDGTKRSSKNTITYLLDNRLTPEQIASSTRVDVEKVKAAMPQEVVIEKVKSPEPALATVGSQTTETNTPQEQSSQETREETRSALIDQAEASMAPDTEKRNMMAEAQSSQFDSKFKQRTTTTETTTPVIVEEISTSHLSYDEQIKENRQKWLESKLTAELDAQTFSESLTPEQQKEALLQQYVALRKEHYEALCYNSGLDMYNASLAITCNCNNKKAMNRHIWNGCKNIDESIVPADSTARMVPQIITSAKERSYLSSGVASCAITGATIVYDVCQKMQFENGATLTPPSERGHQYRSAAGHFSAMDSETHGYTGKGRMADLIASGKIGPGDRISTKTNGDTESGYHLRTVIAVNRNKNGEVTGYVVQGNNNLELSYHDINDRNDAFNKRFVEYSSTSQWANDQIQQEYEKMKDMSIEEIQALIEKEKASITSTILDSVQEKETRLAGLQGGNVKQYYADEYPFLYRDDAPILMSNLISPDMLKVELTSMTGTEIMSPDVYFAHKEFERKVDERTAERARAKAQTSTRYNKTNIVIPPINRGAEMS